MAEINLDFAVSTNNLTIKPASTELAFTPNSTQLNIYTGYTTFAPGSSGQVLINTGGIVNAAATMTYNSGTNTVTVQNLIVTNNSDLGDVGNVKITGGTNGQFIKTDGAGNLSFQSFVAAGSNTQLQYNNNGSFGAVPFVTFNGTDISLGSVDHVKITGGTNGYVLQTDGVGNLTWTAQTGGSGGNGLPGGSNTQVQFNNAGLFGGDSGFTYNSTTNTLTAGNIVSGSFAYSNGSPLTTNPAGSNTQIQFNNSGAFGASANLTFDATTNAFTTGSISTGNISGNVITGNVLTGTLSTNAQPNITSLGTLTTLIVSDSLVVTGALTLQEGIELVSVEAGPVGTLYNFDLESQGIALMINSATTNFVLNFRGNSTTTLDSILTNGQSITCTFINTVTTTGYIPTGFLIDGASVSVLWNGSPPAYTSISGTAKDVYSFNIIKTGSGVFTVLGNAGRYQ